MICENEACHKIHFTVNGLRRDHPPAWELQLITVKMYAFFLFRNVRHPENVFFYHFNEFSVSNFRISIYFAEVLNSQNWR